MKLKDEGLRFTTASIPYIPVMKPNTSFAAKKVATSYKEYDIAIDENGNLVIIELKRDTSGNHVEWQAIKYASYCSAFTDEEIFGLYQEYLNKKYTDKSKNAKQEIEKFIERNDNTKLYFIIFYPFHS